MDNDVDKIDEYLGHLPDSVRDQFRLMYDTVLQFNSKLYLLHSSTLRLSSSYHFADSLRGLEAIESQFPFPDTPIHDFGSGNGFPGLILAITRPELAIQLVERDLRKAEFLNYLISQLGLTNARVLTQSMESLPKQSVSYGLVRNVGSIAYVTIHLTSLYRECGHLFHFKTDNWSSEIASCPTQVFTKWEVKSVGEYSLPTNENLRAIIRATKLG